MGFKSATRTFRRHHTEEKIPSTRYDIYLWGHKIFKLAVNCDVEKSHRQINN